jgi:hypothetical protein
MSDGTVSAVRCGVALLSLFAALPASAQSLEAGRWRVQTTTLSGPPAPPMIATRCLTPQDVADPGKTFGPQVATENSECEPTELKLEPSGLSWRLQCRGQINMDLAAQFIFDGPTRYSAMIVTRATMLERIVQESMVSISAERIGECR